MNRDEMAINNIITLAGIISYGVSWTAIYLLQQSDLIGRVTNVDSWIGGAMGAVLIGGLFKWMLKRHDTLARRVDDLHDQLLEQHREHETKMLEMQRNHFDELMRRIEHETGKWSERAKIGFLMLSTAITALAYVNMSAYRDAVERNTEEVRRLKEDRDHDYRETMTWRLTGWVQRSRTQDRNLGLYRNRFIEIEAYCRRNPCNLPDRLFAPVTIEDTQSTEALLLASEQITQDAPYGTRDDKEK